MKLAWFSLLAATLLCVFTGHPEAAGFFGALLFGVSFLAACERG